MNLTHRKAIEWLQREKDGALDEPALRALEEHLAGCAECRGTAALGRRLALAEGDQALPRSTRRLTDRGLVQAVLRQQRRQQRLWGPLQGLAWAASAVLLVGFLSWSISSLRPSGGAEPAPAGLLPGESILEAPAGAPEEAEGPSGIMQKGPNPFQTSLWELSEWLYEHLYAAGMLPVLLAGLIGVFLGRRQAEITWLAFLLGALALGAGFLFWSIRFGLMGTGLFTLVAMPFLIAVMAMLAVHVWSTPALWTRWTLAILAAGGVGLALLVTGPWYRPEEDMVFSRVGFWIILGLGLLPAILWQGWTWKGWGRILYLVVLAFSLLGPASALFVYFSSGLPNLPWLNTVAGLGYLLGPVAATVLSARLGWAWLSGPTPVSMKRLLAGAAGVFFLFAALFAQVRALSVSDRVDDDHLLGTFLLFWVGITAVMACVAMAWKMPGRRRWAAAALVVVFALALIPAASVPYEAPEQVTEQRAAQINRAILRYQADTGRYPAALAELAPRYLLLIPGPISFRYKQWCYDGGEDYYRLGYAIPVHFAHPGDLDIRLVASAGEVPEQELPCWKDLEEIKAEYR